MTVSLAEENPFLFFSSPQINRSSFSFAAPGESSMSSVGVLELGMSEEGEWFAFFWLTEKQSKIKKQCYIKT